MHRFWISFGNGGNTKKDTLLGDKSNKVSSGGILLFPDCLRLGLEMI